MRTLSGLITVALAIPALAFAEPQKVAVIPLTSLTTGRGANLATVEIQLAKAIGSVSGFQAILAEEVKQTLKRAKRKDLEACEGDAHCLSEVGKLVGASLVITGEVGGFTDGQVVYLKSIDVTTEQETGSTTALFRGKPGPAMAVEARSAAYRLLAPKSYVGTLALKIDVLGAQVFIDGHSVGNSPVAPLSLPVGTHALRITHPKYRDFVRFVDIKFDESENLAIDLKAFAVVSDTMQQTELRRRAPIPIGPITPAPWYHKWWAVAGFGGSLVVATTILVLVLHSGPNRDSDVTIQPPK